MSTAVTSQSSFIIKSAYILATIRIIKIISLKLTINDH